MAIVHTQVSAKPGSADPSIVDSADWNAAHTIQAATITYAMIQNVAAGSLLFNPTAGASVLQEVTPSQLFDAVSNVQGDILTRGASTWQAATRWRFDNGDLIALNTTPSAPPANNVKLTSVSVGGRQMAAQLAAAGAVAPVMPHIGREHVGQWLPTGMGLTTFTTMGMQTPQATGTATARNPAATNSLTLARRVGLVSAATAAAVSGIRTTGGGFFNRTAGFHLIFRFAISDAVLTTTGRMFVGVQANGAAPTDVDPSGLVNIMGIGIDAADGILQAYGAGAAAQARVALPAAFTANTTNVDIYEVAMYCPAGGDTSYQVTRLNTGDVTSGSWAGVQEPAVGTLLNIQMYRTNGVTAQAVGLDFLSFYMGQDI